MVRELPTPNSPLSDLHNMTQAERIRFALNYQNGCRISDCIIEKDINWLCKLLKKHDEKNCRSG